jgi:hypothetical protein
MRVLATVETNNQLGGITRDQQIMRASRAFRFRDLRQPSGGERRGRKLVSDKGETTSSISGSSSSNLPWLRAFLPQP